MNENKLNYKNWLFKKYINLKTILVFVISLVLFFAITVIFNKYIEVYTVSSVRPSATLNPVLGLAYGWPAAIGCALGNFISDLVSGYGIKIALIGIIPQIIYGILPYYLWKLFIKNSSMRTRLDSPLKVVVYIALMAFNGFVMSLEVGFMQYIANHSSFWNTVGFAMLNDFGTCLALGMPIMVLLDHIYSRFLHNGRRKLSDNELIIVLATLCLLISFIVDIVVVYITHQGDSNLNIWSEIYLIALIETAIIYLIALCFMGLIHLKVVKTAGLQILSKKHGTIYVDTKKKIEFISKPGNLPNYFFDAKQIHADSTSYETAWYTCVSSQKGCPMNCAFCDCPGYGFHGNVSKEDLIYQINKIIDTHYVTHTKYFQVDFMRMGEPSLNDEILDFIENDLINTVKSKIDADKVVPYISTMLPNNKSRVEHFLLEYCRIKNEVYKGNALLQFSIHLTNDKFRNILFDNRSLSLDNISDICNKLPTPKGPKYILSFAVGMTNVIELDVLNKLFNKDKFAIKLTPIHATYNAVDYGFATMVNDSPDSPIKELERKLIDDGWQVITCNDSVDEDNEDLTCGKLVLPTIENNMRKTGQKSKVCYGIIAALKYEEDLFRDKLSDVTKITLLNKPAYKGYLGDNEVIIMQCGMGKVSAGICAQTMIDLYHPDFIINTGCAGALDPSLKVGDVVVSKGVVEWDLDLRQIGLPLGYIDALNSVEMKASKILSDKIMSYRPKDVNAKLGLIASGDQFVSSKEQRKIITDNFKGALCAEMEGAAIGHVCLQNDVPFCIIRSMSDTADGNSGVDFAKFSEEASKVSASWLINMLKED